MLCSLEERYSKNNKRRRLAYALRRRQSPSSYRNRWDHLCNEVGINTADSHAQCRDTGKNIVKA